MKETMNTKSKVINTIVESIETYGRPSESDTALEKLIIMLEERKLLVESPTDSSYETVETQVYWLINTDIINYGKASSVNMGAQRAYNLLEEAKLIAED